MKKINLLILALVLLFAIFVGLMEPGKYGPFVMPLLIVYLCVTAFRRIFFTYGALVPVKQPEKVEGIPVLPSVFKKSFPKVSIIVPCYNEEKVIKNTIENLCLQNYPEIEIIVVDDGSSDKTFQTAADYVKSQNLHHIVKVLTQKNAGKGAALNLGIKHSKGDFIMCVDADSKIDPLSIRSSIHHFEDLSVGAVAGFVEIANKNSLLTKFQQYEYMVGLNFTRKALAMFGIVPVIPGPIGIFRRDVLEKVGMFVTDKNLMAEDAELSLRIVSAGYKVKSEPNMIAYTEAPEDLRSLSRQRYRWNRGVIQALDLNLKDMIKSNSRSRILAANLIFDIHIVLLANIFMALSFSVHAFVYGNLQLLNIWFVGLLISEALVTGLVLWGKRNKIEYFGIAMLSLFTYNSALMFWRMFSAVDEFLSIGMTWDKLERKGIK